MGKDIEKHVFKAISEVLGKNEQIFLDASLRDDLGFDSLSEMTLFLLLEDEFHCSLAPEDVTGVVTVRDIINFVGKKLSEPAAK